MCLCDAPIKNVAQFNRLHKHVRTQQTSSRTHVRAYPHSRAVHTVPERLNTFSTDLQPSLETREQHP